MSRYSFFEETLKKCEIYLENCKISDEIILQVSSDFLKDSLVDKRLMVTGTINRDESGNEERPALFILEYLDSVLVENLFVHGKGWIGINKRYLKNMEEIMRVS